MNLLNLSYVTEQVNTARNTGKAQSIHMCKLIGSKQEIKQIYDIIIQNAWVDYQAFVTIQTLNTNTDKVQFHPSDTYDKTFPCQHGVVNNSVENIIRTWESGDRQTMPIELANDDLNSHIYNLLYYYLQAFNSTLVNIHGTFYMPTIR